MSENQITEQLKKVASDVLSEEVLQEIEQAFNESVQGKAEELAQLRVEKALVEQDEEHAIKLEKLLEAIDADHTSKLHRVVEAIDKNHSEKLRKLVEKFRKEIDGDAKVFKEGLVDNISNYLDLYIEKNLPAEGGPQSASLWQDYRACQPWQKATASNHKFQSLCQPWSAGFCWWFSVRSKWRG